MNGRNTGYGPSTTNRRLATISALFVFRTSVGAFRDALGHYEDAGVTDFVVHWPRVDEPYRGDTARFESIMTAVTDP